MKEITFTITGRPISKKNSRRNYGHVSIPSVAYLNFEKEALIQLMTMKLPKFKGPVALDYTFFMKGRLDSDTDNMECGINDILQKSEVIDNDKNIFEHHCRKIPGNKSWSSVIKIRELI